MLINEAEIGHIVMLALGWMTLTILKDMALSTYKGWKFKQANNLYIGDRVLIDGKEATVGGTSSYGVTFIYEDNSSRLVSANKVLTLDLRKMH